MQGRTKILESVKAHFAASSRRLLETRMEKVWPVLPRHELYVEALECNGFAEISEKLSSVP